MMSNRFWDFSISRAKFAALALALTVLVTITNHSDAFDVGSIARTPTPPIRRWSNIASSQRGKLHSKRHGLSSSLLDAAPHRSSLVALAASATTFPDSNSNSDSDSSTEITNEASASAESENSKQSMSAAIFSLVKACVGSGVLALPAGVAAMGDVPILLLPASLLICFLGSLSAYSFYNIGRISHMENDSETKRTNSLSVAWEQEVEPNTSWIISLACFLTPIGSCLTYSIILGDTLSGLARSAGLQGALASRQASILAITASALYPLCNLKSLASLAKVSMVGVFGIALTCAVMCLRALPGGPYNPVNGALLSTLHPSLQPSFGILGGADKIISPAMLVLVSMAATSYLSHFAAPDFYDGLERGSKKRFGILTGTSFAITTLVNILIMSLGFLTFGGNCNGMILNNYSSKDIGATLCRMVVAISLIGSFPINLFGARSAFYELFQKGKTISDSFNKKVTRTLLATLTGLALILEDAGFIVSLSGAVLGSAIIYMFPSIIFLNLTSRLIKEGKLAKTKVLFGERLVNKMLIGLGSIFCVLGGAVTVAKTFFPSML